MIKTTLKHSLHGKVSWKIVRNGKTIEEALPTNNTILNQGLNYVASYAFADCFNYCAIGTNKQLTNIYQTGLFAELYRTNNLSLESGSQGTIVEGTTLVMTRTFVFSSIPTTTEFRELGFSPISTPGANLFSRANFRDSLGFLKPAIVEAGDSLIVMYTLSVEVLSTSVAVAQGVTGVSGTGGVAKFQKFGLKSVSETGATENYDDTNGCNEPSVISTMFLSASGDAPDVTGSCINRNPLLLSKTTTLGNYLANTYYRNKSVDIRPWERPISFQSVGVGTPSSHGAIFVFDNAQSPHPSLGYVPTFIYSWVYVPGPPFPIENSQFPIQWLDGDDYYKISTTSFRQSSYAYFAQ